jgi:starch-binding outer membrane protein, SusD/RagB family
MTNNKQLGATTAASVERALLLMMTTVALAACDLTVDPSVSVPPEVATDNITGVKSLLTSTYSRLQDRDLYGNDLLLLPEILADNARPSTPPIGQSRVAEFSNSIGSHMGEWGDAYVAINEANYTIASAQALVEKEPVLANRYLGEALFLRALLYHDLMRVFAYEPGRIANNWDAGVVLRLEPTRNAADADKRPRAKVEEVYVQIEKDLQQAITILTQHGTTNPYLATRGGAEALLARVYLYWGKWSNAITQATAAMSHTTARLAEPNEVAGMFAKAPNPESLFEVNYDAATETLWVNDCSACYTWPQGTWFSMWPTAELLALFQPGDARLALYPTTPGGVRYVNKYTYARGDWTDNSPVIRFSELMLIRAEAYAESGQSAQALADLNALRAKRNAAALNVTGPALINAILEERRRELAFEGHRWFDLKRRGMDIPKPAFGNNPSVPYTDFRILAPLPDAQVQNNVQLKQNPGY